VSSKSIETRKKPQVAKAAKPARTPPKPARCAFCGSLEHKRQGCTEASALVSRMRAQVCFIKAEKNPYEWERMTVLLAALQFAANLPRAKGRRDSGIRQDYEQMIELAQLAIAAWTWGKK
jgi:hypothetical protein